MTRFLQNDSKRSLCYQANIQNENDYMFEKEICMDALLEECMRNHSERLSKCIYMTTCGFITYNHTVMHSYLTTDKTGIQNI